MAITDTRLAIEEKAILAGLVGKSFDELAHDEYVATPTTYMSAWIVVEGEVFDIHDETEVLDYLGEQDDVAVVSIRAATRDDIHSHLVGCKIVSDVIGRTIEDVIVVEDNRTMVGSDGESYAFHCTAALIFELNGTQVMFEFGPWFSEDIGVERGPMAAKKLPEAIEEIPEEDRSLFSVSREFVSMKNWMPQTA